MQITEGDPNLHLASLVVYPNMGTYQYSIIHYISRRIVLYTVLIPWTVTLETLLLISTNKLILQTNYWL